MVLSPLNSSNLKQLALKGLRQQNYMCLVVLLEPVDHRIIDVVFE